MYWKLLIPFLLGIGTLFTFFREVIVAYYFGTSREVEIYRIAYAIPYALFQSLGTTIVAGLLPLLIQHGDSIMPIIKKEIKKVFLISFLISLLTIVWQSQILAPGFNNLDLNVLETNLIICWLMLFPLAYILPIRLRIQNQDKKVLVSSTSLIYSLSFIIFIYIFHAFNTNYLLASISLLSTGIVFLVYLYAIHNNKNEALLNKKLLLKSKEIRKVIIGSFIYVFMLAVPGLIDKAVASKMLSGTIANIDYAMNFYIAFGILIGTSFTIIFTKKIALEYNREMSKIWLLKIVGIPFFLAAIISLSTLPFVDEIVRIAYFRGAFSENDVIQVSKILYWFLIALPIMVGGMVLMQIVAAFSITTLIILASIKSIVKLSWILLFFNQDNVSIFGISTLAMEIVSMIIILFFLKKNTKSLRNLEL